MFEDALETAFSARLLTYATAQEIAVDWGDGKNYETIKESWLRPRLNPSDTEPGPTEKGPLRGTLRGLYSIECMVPIEQGHDALWLLAKNVANHFLPDWSEPGYLESDVCVIRLRVPSVKRETPFKHHNRAVAHIPYLVYAMSA